MPIGPLLVHTQFLDFHSCSKPPQLTISRNLCNTANIIKHLHMSTYSQPKQSFKIVSENGGEQREYDHDEVFEPGQLGEPYIGFCVCFLVNIALYLVVWKLQIVTHISPI